MPDYSRQRAERSFNMNPPSNAPGQGGDGWDSIFGENSPSQNDASVNNFSGADTNIDSILNGSSNPTNSNNPNAGMGMPQAQQGFGTQIGSALDVAAVKGAKGAWDYLNVVVKSLRNNTSSDWNMLGTRICKVSVGVFVLSMLFLLLSVTVMPSLGNGIDMGVASCFSCMTGLLLVTFNKKGTGDAKQVVTPQIDTSESDFDSNESMDFVFDDDDNDEYDIDESSYGDDDEDDYSDLFSDDEDTGSYVNLDNTYSASNDSFNAQDAVNSLGNVPAGQYTRQYLFETFSRVLPSLQPSFMDMQDVPDSSDEFMMFEDYLRRSAEQTGIKDDKLDELQLLEVRKNLFIIQLLATRPTGLKEKEIAEGVADCYKRDDYGMMISGREGVFSRVNSQVGRLIIDIFLCNNVMVSLGDIFRKKSDFLLDTNNIMPLIWGVSEMGTVFCYDGMKDGNGGMIISGEARSGKSWKGQSLIAQMCMFRSPKQLELYFFDVKGEASDYAYLSRVLPHCKGFCGESLKFNDVIGALLDREAKRRTELIGGKYTNVKDYNKDHPFEEIPTIYIVIDEMATAMSEMKDKDIDIRKKFDSLLIQIATKYPYLEIKLLLFPHRIVNDIINKTVSSMISTRSVMGNVPADDLKSALDVKVFPYSLVKTGDMAIKTKSLNNGNAVYSHSEVLSTSEQVNRKIFDYIGEVWCKLEPDCKRGNLLNTGRTTGSVNVTKSPAVNVSKPVKDTSVFADDFKYTGSREPVSASVLSDLNDTQDDVDESFWDEVIQGSESGVDSDTTDDDDDFDWSQFK